MKKQTALLVVGAQKDAVIAARQAVMEILKCQSAEQRTKRVALRAFSDLCAVKNVNLTGCSFHGSSE